MDIALTVENERLAELLTALRFENRQQSGSVSYTHLTLPTIYYV